ncbi:MAG TPA: carboxypeptidase-like regulatory domain-containing protein [Gammaproteobacteria bacterium]|nr:carboxypeptidase-like regulatory domain-containing protein [Gammaproteobacteria bacterium]
MARPLTILILAIAVGCAALFLLLPMSKIAQHRDRVAAQPASEPTLEKAIEQNTPRQPDATHNDAGATDPDAQVAPEEYTLPVNGRVSNASGAALAGLEIEIESKGFDGEDISGARVVSDRLGAFSLQVVPQRQYSLHIPAAGDYAGYSLDSFTHEDSERLRDIVLERVELVDVDGLIVDVDLSPVADFELSLRHLTLDYPERIIRSDSTGFFSVKGFPAGEWRIATNQSDYFRIKGLELKPGEYRNLTLKIDRGSYHLSGWVRDSYGTPLAEVTVTLKSAFAADGYHSFSYRSLATDANGAFEFAGLGGHRLTIGIYATGFETYIKQYDFKSFSDTLEIVLEE